MFNSQNYFDLGKESRSFQNYVIMNLKMYDIFDKLFIPNDICASIESIDY